MNQLQISYFLHLCGTLNITETARALYVAQPSVSKQIASLEKELGYKLFNRTNRGLSLTESGKIMYQFFSEFQVKFRIADHDARQMDENTVKEITIGILDNLDLEELFDAISEVKETVPGLQVNFMRLGNDPLMTRLKDRRIDFAVTFDHALQHITGVNYEPLVREECSFIVSKMNPLCRKKDLTLQDLNGAVFCHSWIPEQSADEYLYGLLETLNIRPKGFITVENLGSGLECIIANNTVGLIDERIMLPYPERFRIIPTGVYQEIIIAWEENNRNPLIQPLVSRLKQLCMKK